MAVAVNSIFNSHRRLPSGATAASSGITLSTPSAGLLAYPVQTAAQGGDEFLTYAKLNSFTFNIPSDAALAGGQKVFTFPEGWIVPLVSRVRVTSTCATGLSATAGEFGLGTVIGSGANATLGAVSSTAEDIMEGQTLSNHVAATALVSNKVAKPVGLTSASAAQAWGLDGTSTAKVCHFNFASTFDQTAAENITFNSVEIWVKWLYLGDY